MDKELRQEYGLFSTIEENYAFIASNPRNQRRKDSIRWIAPYMKILRRYGRKCSHITEFGVNQVNSTYAFLASRPKKLVSVDIDLHIRPSQKIPEFNKTNHWLLWASNLAKKEGIDFVTIEADDCKIEIEPTDLLFIDSKHSSDHLRKELRIHKSFVKKYIIFHDTTLFKEQLMPPILELIEEGEFEIIEHLKDSPGLLIIERKNNE